MTDKRERLVIQRLLEYRDKELIRLSSLDNLPFESTLHVRGLSQGMIMGTEFALAQHDVLVGCHAPRVEMEDDVISIVDDAPIMYGDSLC